MVHFKASQQRNTVLFTKCVQTSINSESPVRCTDGAESKNRQNLTQKKSIIHKCDSPSWLTGEVSLSEVACFVHGWGEKLSSHPGNKRAAMWFKEESLSGIQSTWDRDHSWCSAARWWIDTLLLLLFLPFDHPIVDILFHVLSALQHYLLYIILCTRGTRSFRR